MTRVGSSGSQPVIGPRDEDASPERGGAGERPSAPAERASAPAARASAASAGRMAIVGRLTAASGTATAATAATEDVKSNIPVAIQESLRASLAKAPSSATQVTADDDVDISVEDRKRLDPWLRRVAEEMRPRGGALARTDLVAEAVRRARIAAQRVAGEAGSADGARLSGTEVAAIDDPGLRALVEKAAALAEAPPPDVRLAPEGTRPSSRGKGGATGSVRETFTDSRGRSGEVALEVPEGATRPLGVLFFFHADGAEGEYASTAAKLRKTAAEHGLLVVSMQEPDEGAWWAPRTADNAAYVKEFLEKDLLAKYDIDASRIFFSGESGGASFAGTLPATLGHAYGGGLILASGGDVPRANGGDPDDDEAAPPVLAKAPPVPPSRAKDFGAYFAIGTEDAELRNVLAAEAYLKRAGIPKVRHELMAGKDHVEFSAVDAIARGLAALDGLRR